VKSFQQKDFLDVVKNLDQPVKDKIIAAMKKARVTDETIAMWF